MITHMPFGRYRGTRICDLPDPYLAWLRSLDNLREPLLSALDAELDARGGVPRTMTPCDATLAQQIISVGYRTLARDHHPDAGGCVETMKKLNATAEWLRGRVGILT